MQEASLGVRFWQTLVAVAGRAAYLSAAYLSGSAGTPRHAVESATLALVVLGVPLLVLGAKEVADEPRAGRGLRGEWALWCLASLCLYWPSIGVGLLSDDFVLTRRAASLQVGPVHGEFFRPLPLLAWSIAWPLTGATGLHVLNILAHGVVAFLSARIAAAFVTSWRAVAAGFVVLAFPSSVEAVAWMSGVFDVTSTLLLVAAVLVSRRYHDATALSTRAQMAACATGALLCKETALVAPLLIALDAWARRRLPRQLASTLPVSPACSVSLESPDSGSRPIWFANP